MRGTPWLALLVVLAGCGRQPPSTSRPFDPDSIPEAYARSTAALMFPGATRAFQITPEGDLFNGAWRVAIEAAAGGVPAGAPRAIAAEDRWMPVFHWWRQADSVRFEFSAAAMPDAAPRDSVLIAAVEVRVRNLASRAREAELRFTLAAPGPVPLFTVFDADTLGESAEALRWGAGSETVPVHGWTAAPIEGHTALGRWTLAPGASATMRVVLPTYPASAPALASWARASHAQRLGAARRYWSTERARGAAFELGDPEIESALSAALVTLLACRERRGPLWVPVGGPFHYRDVWLRDGARDVHALAMAGQTRVSRELADGLLLFRWPHGPFLSQRGQLDGTGQALWAFEQAHLTPAPDTAVARCAEAAWGALHWSERQRALGRRAPVDFGTMLPFGEPRDAELVRAQLVGNDAWMIAGYGAAERLLRAAGRAADADSAARARATYRREFEQYLERTGHPDIPPSWQGVGRDWGNLSACIPCGALSPWHPRVRALAERAWREAGGPGLGFYGSRDSLHTYNFADLATWALIVGERGRADSMLTAMLAWRSASGGGAEMFSGVTRDWGRNPPPHTTSAAALIVLVRNCVLYDEPDTLRLTMGARDAWWRRGRVKRAPTRFGVLELSFRREGDEVEWEWSPVPVWTALTLPAGTSLAAPPPAPLRGDASGTRVLAPPHSSRARVRVTASR